MSGVVRSVGGILSFVAGKALFGGTLGGAITSTLFGLLMPQQQPVAASTGVVTP